MLSAVTLQWQFDFKSFPACMALFISWQNLFYTQGAFGWDCKYSNLGV